MFQESFSQCGHCVSHISVFLLASGRIDRYCCGIPIGDLSRISLNLTLRAVVLTWLAIARTCVSGKSIIVDDEQLCE